MNQDRYRSLSVPKLVSVMLAALLLLGLGLRLFDLTDQPIDFHPTRQLRGAIIARGMYYEMLPAADEFTRQQAIAFWTSTGQYEPSILERAVALTYLGLNPDPANPQEFPWLARVYNTLLWLIGGIALFDLARRLAAEMEPVGQVVIARREAISDVLYPSDPAGANWAGLIALAYYLILPFSVQASRAFQPDPGMVVWMILSAYSAYRWSEIASFLAMTSWKWALLTGIFSGLAILTKAVAFYPIAGILISIMVFAHKSGSGGYRTSERKFFSSGRSLSSIFSTLIRILRDPQVWVIAGLTLLPTIVYYLGRGGRASEYLTSWTLALSHLLLEPQTYLRWLNLAQELLTPVALLLALAGVLLAKGKARFLLVGLWAGYFAYGLFLPYQMTSHSYYHLQLVPIVALSLAPVAYRLAVGVLSLRGTAYLERSEVKPSRLSRRRIWRLLSGGVIVAALLTGLIFGAWQALIPLYSKDYRGEPAYWQQIASYLPEDGKIIALTQDYGYRLMYYGWRKVVLWPNRGEIKLSVLRGSEKDFQDYFIKRIDGKRYFLITAFGQFEDQPALQQTLYENFPILAQGEGYIIFDLQNGLR